MFTDAIGRDCARKPDNNVFIQYRTALNFESLSIL